MEGGDEADEAEADDEDCRRRDLQAGSVVGVEPEDVAAAAAAEGAGGAASAAAEPPSAHPGSSRRRPARCDSDGSRSGGGGRRGLGLRSASCHRCFRGGMMDDSDLKGKHSKAGEKT